MLALALVVALVYYGHVVPEFELGKPALVTAALAFVAYGVFGIFGGLLAGAFYDAFRNDVRAQKSPQSQYSSPNGCLPWLCRSLGPGVWCPQLDSP